MKTGRLSLVYRLLVGLLMVFGLLLFVLPAEAQFTLFDETAVLDVSLDVIPENPAPSSEVVAEVSSFNFDVDRLFITWSVNGLEVAKGVGKKKISFTTGNLGEPTSVQAVIRLTSGQVITKRLVVNPGRVDLLWESVDGYRPPFYKGKILPARESEIKITAIPQINSAGALVSPKLFKYTWEHDYTVRGSLGGFAQDSFSIVNGVLSDQEVVGVTILSRDGKQTTRERVTIPMFEPEILVYEKTKEGRSRLTVDNKTIRDGSGLTLVAEPYHFSVEQNDPRVLQYSWFSGVSKLSGPNGTTLRTELKLQNPRETGVAALSVKAEHPLRIFQIASKNMRINFENN